MADTAYVPDLVIETTSRKAAPRHSFVVRLTHWVFTLSFFGLVVSGFAIILAHPHFYWGETGNLNTPALFSLPLPTMLGGPSGWGRSLHFQSAWFAVLSGLLYVASGILSQHFRNQFVPARGELSWRRMRGSITDHLHLRRTSADEPYNVLQRLSYLAVVFALFPLTILTGFAMSPSITSVFPSIVIIFGGHQSARTLHFFLSIVLCLFLIVHIVMLCISGFAGRMQAMITGTRTEGKKAGGFAADRN
jgi:thiosulfate reductase cytochrome b subunit